MKVKIVFKGGKGSGNFGHAGRPGKRGGSVSRARADSLWFDKPSSIMMRAYSRGETNPENDMPMDWTSEELYELREGAKVLQQAAEESTSKHTTVYRGINMSEDDAIDQFMRLDEDYTFTGLTATTPNEKLAKSYAGDDTFRDWEKTQQQVILRISNPKGVQGYDRKGGDNPYDPGGDMETVLPRGSTYRILNLWEEGKFLYVDLYTER